MPQRISTPDGGAEVPAAVTAAIYQLVSVAGDLTRVADDLRVQLGPTALATLPDPYNVFAAEAIALITSATANLPR